LALAQSNVGLKTNTNGGQIPLGCSMAKALGVGGVFFRARDPESLSAWYAKHLGIEMQGTYVSFAPQAMPTGGATVFAVFAEDTDYFAPSDQRHMINLVVDDLDGALAQVQEGGAELAGEVADYSYGRFGWFLDPEGNKVELWQPLVPPEDDTSSG
jgi:predicted enzyme related to lactoylglutathione lyase